MNRKQITSVKNPYIKEIANLRDNKTLRKSDVFLVEGQREIIRALQCGWLMRDLFVDDESSRDLSILEHIPETVQVWQVPSLVYQKLAMRDHSDGVLGVFFRKTWDLKELDKVQEPLLLCVLSGVEKPGNLGALLRSAEAAAVHGFVLLSSDESPQVDPVNPGVIRASLGTVFGVPLFSLKEPEFLDFCHQKSIKLFGAACSDKAQNFFYEDYTGPTAFVLGSEAFGIPHKTLAKTTPVTIPMKGFVADSLNVSVAGALLFYETLRQRSKKL